MNDSEQHKTCARSRTEIRSSYTEVIDGLKFTLNYALLIVCIRRSRGFVTSDVSNRYRIASATHSPSLRSFPVRELRHVHACSPHNTPLLQSKLFHTTSALARDVDTSIMDQSQQYATRVKEEEEDDELKNWIPLKQEQDLEELFPAVVPKAGSSGEVSALSLPISSPNSTLLSSNAYTDCNANRALLLPIDERIAAIDFERFNVLPVNANEVQENPNRQRECA